MQWTIGRRLVVGFSGVLCLLLCVGGVSLHQSSVAERAARELESLSTTTADVASLDSSMYSMRLALNRFLVEPSPERKQNLDASFEAVAQALKTVQQLDMQIFADEISSVSEQVSTYKAAATTVIAHTLERHDIFYNQCGPTGRKLDADAQSLAAMVQSANLAELAPQANATVANMNRTRLGVARFLFTNDPNEFQLAIDSSKQAQADLALLAASKNTEVAQNATELSTLLRTYFSVAEHIKNIGENSDELRATKVDPASLRTSELAREMKTHLATQVKETQARVTSQLAQTRTIAAALTLGALVLGVITSLLIARSIIRPLRTVVSRLRDIAEGEADLTKRVDQDRRDELGELGKWFNVFVGNMQTILSQVRSSSNDVAAAATQIAASAEEMARGMEQQSSQVAQIGTAMQKMSESVVEVARKSQDATGKADLAGQQATQGGEAVGQTIAGMESINAAVTSGAQSVGELGKRGEQIGEIIKVINDIADQTNLLALNAAIEAARAGEHGRGFAVVADEVRKLAERTQKATEEVAGSIRAIQDETQTAVDRMQTGTKQVEAGVERAHSAGNTLRTIVQSAGEVAAMVRGIAATSEQQSAASEQISRNLEAITSVTREANAGADQASQAATELSKKSEQLRTLVSRFKLEDGNSEIASQSPSQSSTMALAAKQYRKKVAA
jgi:methyl-accepting chemotaxis protein